MNSNAFTVWIPPYEGNSFNPCIPDVVMHWHECHNRSQGKPQPEWEFLGNIGDASPLDHGGSFVYRDRTGIYPPEVHYWRENEEGETYQVYRFQCEHCFFPDGVLSDNRFHKGCPVWFADRLASLADAFGQSTESMVDAFLSSEPLVQAVAWESIGRYFGFENLDSYPETYTREEMEIRYASELASGLL